VKRKGPSAVAAPSLHLRKESSTPRDGIHALGEYTMATKSKKSATRKSVSTRKSAAKKTMKARMRLMPEMKIKVVGKHTRRKDSRYGKQYAMLPKCPTVKVFYAKKGQREVLRAAVLDQYVRVA
jgi:hypothetical protein